MIRSPVILIGRDIQLQQSRLILKPRTPDVWFDWHQDYPAFPHTNFDLLIVTVYLDDSDPDNGCLRVIPGSHRLGPLPHRFTFEGASRTELADKRIVADRSGWRALGVPAGGITVHHGNLLHSSEANLSDRPRSTLQLWYRAADNVQIGGSTDYSGWGLQVRGRGPRDGADGGGHVPAAHRRGAPASPPCGASTSPGVSAAVAAR